MMTRAERAFTALCLGAALAGTVRSAVIIGGKALGTRVDELKRLR